MSGIGSGERAKDYIRNEFSYFPNGGNGEESMAPLAGQKPTGETTGTQAMGAEEGLKGEGAGGTMPGEGEKSGHVGRSEEAAKNPEITGYDSQESTLLDMIKRLKAPETEAERKARERKERSKRIIGAVSDGIRALSNLYFTSRYAPHSYDHERQSQLGATESAIGKARAEREKNDDAYFNLALKLGDVRNQRARTLREMEAEAERQRIAQANLQIALNRDAREGELQEDKRREQKGKADKATNEAGISALKLDNAPEELRLRNDNLKLQGEVHKSQIGKNKAQAGAASRSGRGQTFLGKEYLNFNDYKKAISAKFNELNSYFKGKDSDWENVALGWKKVTQDGYNYDDWGVNADEMEYWDAKMKKEKANKGSSGKGKVSPTSGGATGKKSPTR